MKGNVTALGADFMANEASVRTLDVAAQLDRDVAFVNCGFRVVCDDADRITRGGSWHGPDGYARDANRVRRRPEGRGYALGFRLARDMEGTWQKK